MRKNFMQPRLQKSESKYLNAVLYCTEFFPRAGA